MISERFDQKTRTSLAMKIVNVTPMLTFQVKGQALR